MKLYTVTVFTAIQVELQETVIRVEETVGSVEIVLIANQTHNETFGVRVLHLGGTAREIILQCVIMFVHISLYHRCLQAYLTMCA